MEPESSEKNEKQESEGETLKVQPSLSCDKGLHFFIYEQTPVGIGAKCTKCPVGFPISPGTVIREGHIYLEGNLVV